MNNKSLFFTVIFIIFLICTAEAIEFPGKPPADEQERQIWYEKVKEIISNAMPYTIYGKVIDQNGSPVVNAEVKIGWHYLSLPTLALKTGKATVSTDTKGVFSNTIINGDNLGIFGIKKKGYEWERMKSPDPSKYAPDVWLTMLKDEDNPLVYYMRKRAATTYLYNDGYGHKFDEDNEFVIYDIFDRGFDPIDRDLTKLRSPFLYDLIFDVTKSGDGYTLKILPVQETGSMQIVDQLLYEAPADGYQPEVTINMTAGERRETYLYFTSRDPAVYSRMEMILDADNERLRLRYDTWTNPYGSRNLEYELDLPNKLRHVLRKEATKALKSKQLPPEPDIPALIASGEYN